MIYNFPRISTINDILPYIKDAEEFFVADKQDYLVVNYTHRTVDTFPPIQGPNDLAAAIRRECRGIKFYPNGDIMARPFHKFFNMDENIEVSQENVIRELGYTTHHLLEKLDGSMIHPLFLDDGDMHLATKMGITDTSMIAQRWLKNNDRKIIKFICDMESIGVTPIFEWISRKSKIVIDYPQDGLILTAGRYKINGQYFSYDKLVEYANNYRIAYVDVYRGEKYDTFSRFVDIAVNEEQREGYVVKMDNGHMIKVKNSWYVSLHKSKEAVRQEKDVLKLILDDQVDDLLPLLNDEDKKKVLDFQLIIWKAIYECTNDYDEIINSAKQRKSTPKEFALEYAPKTKIPSIAFNSFNGKTTTMQAIIDYCKKNCNTRKSVDNVRALLGENIRYEEIIN